MYATLLDYRSFWTPTQTPSREGYHDLSPSWLVLQYDNRPLSDIDKEFVKRNQAYCDLHGYKYLLVNQDDGILPPYWTKVKLVQDHVPHYRGVMWLDTDAVMVSSTSIESLFPSDKHMMFSPDAPLWALQSPFNAGVWMVRNTEQGNAILKKWMDCYRPEQWNKNGSVWTSMGIWAGDTYEQGAFSSFVLPHVATWVHSVDWSVLQDVKKTEVAFSLHFSDHQKSLRSAFLSGER